MSDKKKTREIPALLKALLEARSPTGAEYEAQAVLDKAVKPVADGYEKDPLGNRIATIHMEGDPVVMLAGHMDELGLIVSYIDKNGFIYFDTLGGHDHTMISGRRVTILTQDGPLAGVTGKRAVHLMTPEDRKRVPEIHEMWIDIGAKTQKEAQALVRIGDPVVYNQPPELLLNGLCAGRACDDKVGCYVVFETLIRLAHKKLAAKLVSVATTQEEIGTRGAATSSYAVKPDIAIAVDVGHSTDHPDCDPRKHGQTKLGGGPIITRGPNINPVVFDRLIACAKKEKIPYQLEADPRPTGTDARVIQMARGGVATGLISVPLRYMHTPGELISLDDVENTVRLLTAFVSSLKKGDRGVW